MWFALVWPILSNNFTLTNEIKSSEYFGVMATTGAIRRMCMENFFEEISLKRQKMPRITMFHLQKVVIKATFLSSWENARLSETSKV